VLALFARRAAFLRTPKTSERARWWEALRANWAESALALLGLAGIVAALSRAWQLSGPLLAALLVFPTLGLAAAPFNSWAAQRAVLPRWLRERRQSEYQRDQRAVASLAATGGLVGVLGAVIAAVVLLVAPAHQPVRTPDLVGPARGGNGAPAPAASPHSRPPRPSPRATSPSGGSSPSPTTTPTPSSTPTPSPSPTPTPTPTSTPTPLPTVSPSPTLPAASPAAS
jgi:hypothetical protein